MIVVIIIIIIKRQKLLHAVGLVCVSLAVFVSLSLLILCRFSFRHFSKMKKLKFNSILFRITSRNGFKLEL